MAGQSWYHTFHFDSGVSVRGTWDIEPDIAGYRFPKLKGRTVLDIGAASGWFSCWFAQQGAKVTAVDAGDPARLDWFGGHADAGYLDFEPSTSQVQLISDALDLDIEVIQSTIYDVGSLGRRFDVVFLGCILIHVRDAIGALSAVRAVCKEQMICSSPVIDDKAPIPLMYWEPRAGGLNWFVPNDVCYPLWFEAAGWSDIDVWKTEMRADLPTRRESGELVNKNLPLTIARARP